MVYRDRLAAGAALARRLRRFANDPQSLVVALPRGGVPVGSVIAQELHLPLDLFFVKKIPSPYNQEVAIGAVSENGMQFVQERVVHLLGVSRPWIEEQVRQILERMREQRKRYERVRKAVASKRVILVDDGAATGSSLYLGAKALREEGAEEVVIATPVAAPESVALLQEVADQVVIDQIPRDFMAVGQYYHDFHQLHDEEVVELLRNAP